MGVFKEEVWILEDIQRKQTRLKPDACDEGVYLSPGGVFYQELKKSVAVLKDAFKFKEESWGVKLGPRGKRITLSVPWEKDAGLYFCTKYVISYHITGQGSRQRHYVNVYTENHYANESPFKGKI